MHFNNFGDAIEEVVLSPVAAVVNIIIKGYWTSSKINCGMAESLRNEDRACEMPSPMTRPYHN